MLVLMSDEPTAGEKREAARKRVRTVADGINTRHQSRNPRTTKLSSVRVEDSLASRITEYSNTNHLTYSESVRSLIETGLQTWENQQ